MKLNWKTSNLIRKIGKVFVIIGIAIFSFPILLLIVDIIHPKTYLKVLQYGL